MWWHALPDEGSTFGSGGIQLALYAFYTAWNMSVNSMFMTSNANVTFAELDSRAPRVPHTRDAYGARCLPRTA